MKLKIIYTIILIQAVLLTSCSRQPSPSPASSSSSGTTISTISSSDQELNLLTPHPFSQGTRDFTKMLFSQYDITMYDFKVSDQIKHVSLSYKEYQKGELTDQATPVWTDLEDLYRDYCSLAISLDPEHGQIKLSVTNGKETSTSTSDEIPNIELLNQFSLPSDLKKITEKTEITANTEIPLLIYAANHDKSKRFVLKSPGYYSDHVSEFKNYDCVYFFTCTFS